MRHCIILILAFIAVTCSERKPPFADTVIKGGMIYTATESQPVVEAIAIKGDSIVASGSWEIVKKLIGDSTQILDLQGTTMTPGIIESHGHLMSLGFGEMTLDLSHAKNYNEIVEQVRAAVAKAKPGQWIIGRGWHQEKWDQPPPKLVKGFQTHELLSAASPNNPVYLFHASGHAGFANAKAMEIAGVNLLAREKKPVKDDGAGEVIRDELGNPTGIFNERAQELVASHIPPRTPEQAQEALDLALAACLRNGVTSFHDADMPAEVFGLLKANRDRGKLSVRLYEMISGDDQALLEEWYNNGPMIDRWLTVRAIKLHCDGALGSRGAWLLEEYSDRPGHFGNETLPMATVLKTARAGLAHGFQVCSHAIGDRANREILNNYEEAFRENPEKAKDARFRIEHAQHLNPADIPRFGKLGVIASMQTVHLSSDRPWAIERLGQKRITEGAYMWQSLLKLGAKVINGTDVPVEPINPIASFYAAVTRKTLKGQPEGGYEPAERMTRVQALRASTADAAFGAFEEKFKGTLEPGKLADFTVFSKDLMTVRESELLSTEIVMTIVGGKIAYQKPASGK